MQIDLLAEGDPYQLDEWERWMNTRVLNLKGKDKDGKEVNEPKLTTLRVRRAYSYIFPREHLDVVLNTLQLQKMRDCKVNLTDNKGKSALGFPLRIMRKLLRLKKFPKPDKTKGTMSMIAFPHMRLIGLGYRDDVDFVNEKGATQEAL